MKETRKVAFIDWNNTLAKWDNSLRQKLLIEVLQENPEYLEPDIIRRINDEFSSILQKADSYYQEKFQQKVKTVTTIIDYAYRNAPEDKRENLIATAKAAYDNKKTTRVALNDGVIEQLQLLSNNGYVLTIISNKDKARMESDYAEVLKNNPNFAELLPWSNIFVSDNETDKKPRTSLFHEALLNLNTRKEIHFDGSSIDVLFIADSPEKDVEAALKLRQEIRGGNFRFALLHPEPTQERIVSTISQLEECGIEAFSCKTWSDLGTFFEIEQREQKPHIQRLLKREDSLREGQDKSPT